MMRRGIHHVQSSEKMSFDVATGSLALCVTVPYERAIVRRLMPQLFVDPAYVDGYFGDERVLGTNEAGERITRLIPKIQTMLSTAYFASFSGSAPLENSHKLNPRIVDGALPLRDSGLDELPQLRAVAAGWLSWVGPRPCGERHLDEYLDKVAKVDRGVAGAWEEMYMLPSVRKGVTGPGQLLLAGHDERDTQLLLRSMKADLRYYLERATLVTDLWQILRTPGVLCLTKTVKQAKRKRSQV